jgi:hypothetical protein
VNGLTYFSPSVGRYHFGFTNSSSSTGHQLSGGHGPEIWHIGPLMYLPARRATNHISGGHHRRKQSKYLHKSVRTTAKCVELKERDVLHARLLACCQALIEASRLEDARPTWATARLVSPRTVEGAEADCQLRRWDSAANMQQTHSVDHTAAVREHFDIYI